MKCSVEHCDKEARYKAACLCQKHYFRFRRYGTTNLSRTARPRYEDGRGYQFIYAPDHPLINRGQFYVPEHRAVLFSAIGCSDMSCAICGKSISWDTCDVDHIDENPRNNSLENLRPTCRPCNMGRGRLAAVGLSWTHKISFGGETKTPTEWARDPRVSVSGSTIMRRKKLGASDEDSIFGPKKTHNGKGLQR